MEDTCVLEVSQFFLLLRADNQKGVTYSHLVGAYRLLRSYKHLSVLKLAFWAVFEMICFIPINAFQCKDLQLGFCLPILEL